IYAIWRIAYAYNKRLQLLPSLGWIEPTTDSSPANCTQCPAISIPPMSIQDLAPWLMRRETRTTSDTILEWNRCKDEDPATWPKAPMTLEQYWASQRRVNGSGESSERRHMAIE
ncbi:MAG: hypothetical protein ACREJN_20460, partial [Nitrospiraceae bacterium]